MSDDGRSGGAVADPLIGTWTYTGEVPDDVTLALTFGADGTCTIVEQVAPAFPGVSGDAGTLPAPSGCVVTDTYLGTYAETEAEAGATKLVTMTFTSGTANAVSGCAGGSGDSPGTPMTDDSIASLRSQGLVPAMTVTYAVTSAGLVISPGLGTYISTTLTNEQD